MNDFPSYWIDRRTGKKVYIRDAVQDGDGLIVISDMGQIPTEDFMNYYVKDDGEATGSNTNVLPEVSDSQFAAAINKGLDAEDRITIKETPKFNKEDILNKPLNLNNSASKADVIVQEKKKPELSANQQLIKKVFEKNPNVISVDFNIDEKNWPLNEINMLINIFDVTQDEIVKYLCDSYFDNDLLKKELSESIKLVLDK